MKKFTLYFLLLPLFSAVAQEFKPEKVTLEMLQQKSHPTDTSAAAAILYKVGQTSFNYTQDHGFVYRTEMQMRIKIYKKDALFLGTVARAYYVGSPKEKLHFSDAATYNAIDGKVVKSKLKSEGEFEEKINKDWARRKITLPDIKEGSVIEYTMTIESPHLSTIDPWDFQSGFPIEYCFYKTKIPEYFGYRVAQRGYIFPEVQQSIEKRLLDYSHVRKDLHATGTVQNAERRSIQFNEAVTTYTIHNVPAMRDEQYVNNINNYLSGIKHELVMTRYPDAPAQHYSTTWEDVVKTIYNHQDFGVELGKTSFLTQVATTASAGGTSPGEKAAAIFSFVKSHMNWDGDYGYYCKKGIKKAFEEKTGNVAEINLLLIGLLRNAGLNANPVLVSTRSHGIPLSPSRTAFNYVIAAIEIQNDLILLDATSKFAMPNVIPVEALNWTGLIVRENGSSAPVDLMPKKNSKEIVTIMAEITQDGQLQGKLRDQYFDYNALQYRTHYGALSKDSYIEKLEGRFTGFEIESIDIQNADMTAPVTELMDFRHTNAVDVVGNKMYFSPLLFLARRENPFKAEKREYPVDFSFPYQDKYTISITIPQGFEIESIPAPQQLSMEKNLGTFALNISATGNKLQVLCTFDINQAIVGPEDYPMLQSFFKKMIEKQNEKIVLKKI